MSEKRQRIRDPIHNIIEFDDQQFERTLWNVIQTRPFQRLRRVKQLGFSDYVFPGATHTRFAHSIGVFHTARKLLEVLEARKGIREREQQARVALAASLVHDVGHGMFSHAFEEIGKSLGMSMARHETVSERLISEGEIAEVLSQYGGGFSQDVATLIGRKGLSNFYDAIVSSQFDADRLDYMQRDRFMAGLQHGGIDFHWLLNNLEVGSITVGVDDERAQEIETFVLGPKAIFAAEEFVLALFHLYPTIYFHKATRATEKVFTALMTRVLKLAQDESVPKTGLSKMHPFIRFAENPDDLNCALALDDTVFWGSLPLLVDAPDEGVALLARRMRDRLLPKCIDLYDEVEGSVGEKPPKNETAGRKMWMDALTKKLTLVEEALVDWSDRSSDREPRILVDRAERDPYKQFEEAKGPLNQIHIKAKDGSSPEDIRSYSAVVSSLDKFRVFRAYVDEADHEARDMVREVVAGNLGD